MMLSIIIATYGRSEELKALLSSIFAQSYKEFEVLIIDQNDDDRISKILQERKIPVGTVRVFKQKNKNLSLSLIHI